jgi:hypothetical protein
MNKRPWAERDRYDSFADLLSRLFRLTHIEFNKPDWTN